MTWLKRQFILDGRAHEVEVLPDESVRHLLQRQRQNGFVNQGCNRGDCGACTILLNGQPVNACLVLAVELVNTDVVDTADAMALRSGDDQHIVNAFLTYAPDMCEFCRSGLCVSTKALLRETPSPTDQEIREMMAGHLCCSAFDPLVQAVNVAARTIRESRI